MRKCGLVVITENKHIIDIDKKGITMYFHGKHDSTRDQALADHSKLNHGLGHTLNHDSIITENRFSNIWKYSLPIV